MRFYPDSGFLSPLTRAISDSAVVEVSLIAFAYDDGELTGAVIDFPEKTALSCPKGALRAKTALVRC